MTRWIKASFLALACVAFSSAAFAVDCGPADCGPHGQCDPAGLAARCRCDDGYVSVSTYIASGRNFGAFCAPLGALPSVEFCQENNCGPHGVCVVHEADAGPEASCLCDLGYAATADLACEDDKADDSEAVCDSVACGLDSTCMAVPDGVTCRCAAGGVVVLGARSGENPPEKFGPACSFPLDAKEACGPDGCGPKGECILGQAVVCDCAPGFEELRRTASDGKRHGYCLPEGSSENPAAAPPPEYTVSGGGDGGLQRANAAGSTLEDPDASAQANDAGREPPKRESQKEKNTSGGSCRVADKRVGRAGLGDALLVFVALLAARRRRPAVRS